MIQKKIKPLHNFLLINVLYKAERSLL